MSDGTTEYLKRLRGDFSFFQRQVFRVMGWDKVDPPDDITDDMCEYFQHGPTRKILLAPRSDGKTHRIVAVGAVHDLFVDPDNKIGIISKSISNAKQTIHLVKELVDNVPFLEHLQPRASQRDTTTYFDAGPSKPSRTPSVWAIGLGGQRAGNRAHHVYVDDIEDDENTITVESREFLLKQSREFDNIASYGDRRVTVVGTYHHEESIYIKMHEEGYAIRTWPLTYPTSDERERILGLAPIIEQALDSGDAKQDDIVRPGRYSRDYINEKKSRGRSNYAMQFMLIADLGDAEKYPLRLSDLIVFDNVDVKQAPIGIVWGTNNGQGQSTRIQDIPMRGFPGDGLYAPVMFTNDEWANYLGTIMFIDPSGRGKDKTGIAIASYLNGYVWVHHVDGLTGGHDPATLKHIALTARRYNVERIIMEDAGVQDAIRQLLEPVVQRHWLEPGESGEHPNGWKCSVEGEQVGRGQKEIRILSVLEPVTSQHRIVVDRSVVENLDFQHQYTRITKQRGALAHEDELEAFANAIGQWLADLASDPQSEEERSRQREVEEELSAFYKGIDPVRGTRAGMKRPATTRWFEHH